jgi:hypothetical protein
MKPLNIKLYDIARTKLNFNDDDAMEFVSSIHELNDHRFENLVTKEFLSEKIHGIDQRFTRLESNIDQRFTTSQASNNLQFNEIKTSIDSKISESKSELIRWMFIFWAGQMTITMGIMLLFVKN